MSLFEDTNPREGPACRDPLLNDGPARFPAGLRSGSRALTVQHEERVLLASIKPFMALVRTATST